MKEEDRIDSFGITILSGCSTGRYIASNEVRYIASRKRHFAIRTINTFVDTTQGTVLSAVCDYIFLSFFICDKQHREPSPDVVDVVTWGLFVIVIIRFSGNSKKLRVRSNVVVRDHGYAQTSDTGDTVIGML